MIQKNIPQQELQITQKREKDIRKLLIPIISILIIVLLGIMIYSITFKSSKKINNEPISNQTIESNNENNKNNQKDLKTVGYGGYIFTLLDGYKAIISKIYGLIIYNSDIAYTIGVDYTNNYDMYKNAFINYAPQLEANLFTSFMDKEYLIYNIVDTDIKGSQYETKANETTTFTGLIVKKDFTIPTKEELKPISIILSSAKNIETDDIKGSSDDFGIKVGITIYQINPIEFPFEYTNTDQ